MKQRRVVNLNLELDFPLGTFTNYVGMFLSFFFDQVLKFKIRLKKSISTKVRPHTWPERILRSKSNK